jgi:hypothetical protein
MCGEPIETSIDEKDPKQKARQSPIEYVVSIWFFYDIVCVRKDRVVNQDTASNMTKATKQDTVVMLLNDKHQGNEGAAEVGEGWQCQ